MLQRLRRAPSQVERGVPAAPGGRNCARGRHRSRLFNAGFSLYGTTSRLIACRMKRSVACGSLLLWAPISSSPLGRYSALAVEQAKHPSTLLVCPSEGAIAALCRRQRRQSPRRGLQDLQGYQVGSSGSAFPLELGEHGE